MTQASICTIGDEILIGQITDTNSSGISRILESIGIKVTRMLSIGDDRNEIIANLRNELANNDIVICTGGLGPTKDDITKAALSKLSGSERLVMNGKQSDIITNILHSRGLDSLEINKKQALVPEKCEVIPNKLGTAPIMIFRSSCQDGSHCATLYSLPGVPHEAIGAMPDIINDISEHYPLSDIYHKSVMTFGMAESLLSEKIESWENDLPEDIHLAYLPNQLTGVRLRLSIYGGKKETEEQRIDKEIAKLQGILGNTIYSLEDDTLENTVGRLLKKAGKTLSAAESCTGGKISELVTSVPGASEYYLGSVTSYAIKIKERILGVPEKTISEHGVVSSEVAAAMAEGVRRITGSDYSVSTTGLAGPSGDEWNPVGTVWIGVCGPNGTTTVKKNYKNDRKRNIERFAAAALNTLRIVIGTDIND
ncbi:MAG: CinA family nicotinamide mononucleotide deamidase-related protein [Bacteroidales bacterium]|jgi:nicotinamide-nucleotide amidase|nr:CinA family nicotinamide mononucleotide deamidase-related protein [Bacteroidales bacterium]